MNETIIYFNSNKKAEPNLLAFGVTEELVITDGTDSLARLQSFIDNNKNKWIFGYLTYDLKNEIESLKSQNHDGIQHPKLSFIVPKVVYAHFQNNYEIIANYDVEASKLINPEELMIPEKELKSESTYFNSRTPKSDYLKNVSGIISHINRGDIYEANYCVEFYREQVQLAPKASYWLANEQTQAPYSVYFQHGNHINICCSPELFIERQNNKIVSKPIKGTTRRGKSIIEDQQLKNELVNNQKERSENVMIVDLVRNDLSKIAERNSVQVEELYGIYSFKTVHQMISTIGCTITSETSFLEILKATFPMGSMTGAPKISAMNLIEKFENMKRGLYSGSMGFIAPSGDFVFNVVIRSLLYNTETKYLSLMAGGAITAKSQPEQEYRECLLKVAALKKAVVEFNSTS